MRSPPKPSSLILSLQGFLFFLRELICYLFFNVLHSFQALCGYTLLQTRTTRQKSFESHKINNFSWIGIRLQLSEQRGKTQQHCHHLAYILRISKDCTNRFSLTYRVRLFSKRQIAEADYTKSWSQLGAGRVPPFFQKVGI